MSTDRKHYTKPHLQQIDLGRTPKVWRLLEAVLPLHKTHAGLLTDTLCLAYYAAALAQGMQVICGGILPGDAARPPPDPDREDHGTDMLTDREGRLAGMNICAGRAHGAIRDGDHETARDVIADCLRGLGLTSCRRTV